MSQRMQSHLSACWWRCVLGVAFALALAGCSTTVERYHGVTVFNKSSARIDDVTVRYGEHTLKFPGALAATVGERGSAGQMRVPPQLTVLWTASDGSRKEATAPIRLKGLPGTSPVAEIQIHITDQGIRLVQGVPVPPVGREYTPIYP